MPESLFALLLRPSPTGHLEMVHFLLEAGADQEHKTDEMHTALMEACMVSKHSQHSSPYRQAFCKYNDQ